MVTEPASEVGMVREDHGQGQDWPLCVGLRGGRGGPKAATPKLDHQENALGRAELLWDPCVGIYEKVVSLLHAHPASHLTCHLLLPCALAPPQSDNAHLP